MQSVCSIDQLYILLTHDEGIQVEQPAQVSRLLKRIYNLWLPQSSYPATWDADKVVNPYDNGALPLKLLRGKLTSGVQQSLRIPSFASEI